MTPELDSAPSPRRMPHGRATAGRLLAAAKRPYGEPSRRHVAMGGAAVALEQNTLASTPSGAEPEVDTLAVALPSTRASMVEMDAVSISYRVVRNPTVLTTASERVARRAGDHAEGLAELSEQFRDSGRYEEALLLADAARRLAPFSRPVMGEFARALLATGQNEAAGQMFAVLAGHFALDEDWDSAAHAFALAIAVWTVTRDLERAHQMLQRAIAVCDQGASVDAQLTVANAAASMHPEQAVRLVMAALDVPEGTPVQPVESWLTPARRRLLLSPSLRGVHLVLGWYATGLASVDDDLDAPPEESWARVVGLALERLGFVASAAAGYQEAADEAYAQGALDRAARFYDWHNRLWSPDHAEHWGDHYHYALQGAEAVEQYRVALEHAEHDFDRYRLFTKIVDASMLGERDQVWLDQAITWIAEGAKALPSTEARAVADLLAPLDSEAALGVYQASLGQAHLPLHPINAWIADRAQLGADGLSALARAIAHHWSWDDLPLLSPESRAAVDAA